MQTLERQLATIVTEPGEYQYHAEFVRYSDNTAGIESVKVFLVRDDNNSERIYLGDLEVNDFGYVGELIFNLDVKAIAEMTPKCATDSIHVPLNVLQEIAAYRLTPQETAKATA